ncbi:exporter of polyketide antibiotics [Sphaerisporangium flaviroseum]|uniref:Exporter of polyketide antibiotics n=1 Tax=Sphaerisporangium flaviroseum TaxID=509199 RepID=A0ABP7I8Y8_9ACTN
MTTLTGAGKLVRLILRRDRLLMLWIPIISVVPVSYVASINEIYPTAAGRQQYADASANNGGFVALYGPPFGSSLGELVAWRAGFIPVMVGLFSLLMVIRHTRTEEEAGRRELLGSTVVGRHAGLAAALVTTFGVNLLLALLMGLALIGQGLPAAGSFAMGAECAAAGWMFAAVGGLTAQLTEGAGSARGIAVSILGTAYVLRVAGDLSGDGDGVLSWVSPIAWVVRIHPYGDNRWWLLALAASLTAVLTMAAVALSARRDVGAGLLPARLGPATAAPGLRSPLALAWRLHRGLLAGWVAGFAALGLVLGGLAKNIGDLARGNQMQDIFARMGGTGGIIDAYLAAVLGLLGLFAAAYAIQATLRLRSEESALRAEPVLATSVGRLRWAGSHIAFSIAGPAAGLAAAGLAAGLAHGLNTGDVGREVPRVLAGALVQLPAVWVLAAIAIALSGLLPRLAPAAWGALAVCLLLGLVGAVLRLSQTIMDVSPFTHIPKAPAVAVSAAPLLWLAAIALALAAAGLAGLRRRDIPVM